MMQCEDVEREELEDPRQEDHRGRATGDNRAVVDGHDVCRHQKLPRGARQGARVVAAAALLVALTACGGSDGGGSPPTGPDDPPSGNVAPSASISSPSDGATFTEGETVTFQGSATDPEDGDLTGDALVWRSNLDGQVGTGESFTRDDLTEGSHEITLEATDSEGASGTAEVDIELEGAAQSRIVVSRAEVGDGGELLTMAPDGTDTVAVTRAEVDRGAISGVGSPTWSPDGSRIAFSAKSANAAAGNKSIFTIGPDGQDLTQLTDVAARDLDPAWSPDGSRIAFCRLAEVGAPNRLLVIDQQGTVQRSVELLGNISDREPGLGCDPHWSPDGSEILFDDQNPDTGRWRLIIWNLARGEFFIFDALSQADNLMARWSPAGDRVAFTSNQDGDFDIHVLDLTTNSVTQLTTDVLVDAAPAWSPDGSRIAFASDRTNDGVPQIFVMNADGSGIQQITVEQRGLVLFEYFDPDWHEPSTAQTSVSARGRLLSSDSLLRRGVLERLQRPSSR